MRSFRLPLSFALATLAGCSVGDWNDFESDSAIKTIRSTSPFPDSTFGIVLSSYRVSTAGHELSRIVVGSGVIQRSATDIDSIYGAYSFWEDDHLESGAKLYTRCDGITTTCPSDAGSRITPVADVRGGHGCVLAGAPTADPAQAMLTCESAPGADGDSLLAIMSPAAPTSLFGQSLATIAPDAPNLGLAFASAPNANELYVFDSAGTFSLLPLAGFTPTAPSGFGTAITAAPIAPVDPADLAKLPLGTENSFLAVASPGENRVYLLLARFTAPTTRDVVLIGCVDGPRVVPTLDDGFGTVMSAGDLNGDGMPEVVLGAALDAVDRADSVTIVSLDEIDLSGGAPGCADPSTADDPITRVLACPADPNLLIGCEGFGASIAIGDADNSVARDLLVGAPLATVGDISHAGSAFLFGGDASLDVLASTANEPARLVDSSPTVNDTLGLAVTFAASQLSSTPPRDEAIVSVPGSSRLYAFLCTGLPGDSLADDPSSCLRGD